MAASMAGNWVAWWGGCLVGSWAVLKVEYSVVLLVVYWAELTAAMKVAGWVVLKAVRRVEC
jgi:hypothetical protein